MKKTLSLSLVFLSLINILVVFSLAGNTGDVIPSVPQKLTAENYESGTVLSWMGAEGAIGYKIYRCEPGGEYVHIGDSKAVEGCIYTDSTVVSGKEYLYIIKAYSAFSESDFSENCTITHLGQPMIVKAESVYGGIQLEWTESNGAEGYIVYRKNSEDDIVVIADVKDAENCTFKDASAIGGFQYDYAVVAYKDLYKSSYIYTTSEKYIVAPVLKKASNCNGYIKIIWEKTKTATAYKIYKKTADTDWLYVDTVSNKYSTYKDKKVKNSEEYYYTVCAVEGNLQSGFDSAGVKASYVSAPKELSVKNYYSNSILVKWNKVSGAKEYIVYRKDAKNKAWVKLAATTALSYKDIDIVNGRKYTYSVKAKGEESVSGYSKKVKLMALKRVSGIKLSCGEAGVRITWDKMSSATDYRVYRKTEGSSEWKLIKKITDASKTSYRDTSVKEGRTYFYRVIQVNGSTKGSALKNGVKIKFVKAPAVTLKHSPNGVVISWNNPLTGDGYKIQRKASGQKKWKTIAVLNNPSKLTYTDAKPLYGKKNNYRVVVKNTNLISGSKYIYGINPKKKMVALTYDDGPHPTVTNQILDVLEKYNARATFFVVGSRVPEYVSCIRREASMDCEIGNHTYNHTTLTTASVSTIKSEISSTNEEIKKLTGKTPRIVRAPGGAVNATVKANVAYPLFNWSVDTLDWKYRNSDHVISSVKRDVRDGSIVLMHDLYGSTGDASEVIIPWLIKNGYQLVTVSELMAVKGIEVEKGNLYNKAY